MNKLSSFKKPSAAVRLANLRDTLAEAEDRINQSREKLAEVVAETGDPSCAAALKLSEVIENAVSGRASILVAIPKVEAEIAEAETAVAKVEKAKKVKVADDALGKLALAALDFDKAAAALESASLAFRAAHSKAFAAVGDAGGHLASAHLPGRIASAFAKGVPSVFKDVDRRLHHGLPMTGSNKVRLADSFAHVNARRSAAGE